MQEPSSPAGAQPHSAYERIAQAIREHRDELIGLARQLHRDPEVSFQEERAAEQVSRLVEAAGYRVDRPVPELPTAVRGTLCGASEVSPEAIVAVLAEYDALKGLGHGCGHNLMAMAGVGAAIGLAAIRDLYGGEVRFLGTPAEERGAGKQVMIEHGLFDGVDAAVLFHPADTNSVGGPALALEELTVTFRGAPAHASASPWAGRNALDAMIQLFTSIGLWRQQLTPDSRVHGVIDYGGDAPNIIPERADATFMLRSADDAQFAIMQRRFRAIADSAAAAHDCGVEITSMGYSLTMKNNGILGERFREHISDYGILLQETKGSAGSTDMGNVSHKVPSIHPYLAICENGTPAHTVEFRDAAATERAHEVALTAAVSLARTAYDVMVYPKLRAESWKEFSRASLRAENLRMPW